MISDIVARGLAAKAAGDLAEFQDDVSQALSEKADLVNGKVPAGQLPSYVDDVVSYPTSSDFPEEGERDKIYIADDTGFVYRWDGSIYVEINASSQIIEYEDVAHFPQVGESGCIYISQDTNKQYRWDGSNYVELSKEDEVELVSFQTETALTASQIRKAKKGKLIVYNATYSCTCWPSRIYNNRVFFVGHSVKAVDGVNVQKDATCTTIEINLDTTTGLLSNVISVTSDNVLKDDSDNFIDASTAPVASGKRLVREMNVAGKLIPSYAAADAGKVVKINSTGTSVELADNSIAEAVSLAELPSVGVSDVLYITQDTNKQYRWDGSAYVELSREDEIETVNFIQGNYLSQDQIKKLLEGKLVINYQGRMHTYTPDFDPNYRYYVFSCQTGPGDAPGTEVAMATSVMTEGIYVRKSDGLMHSVISHTYKMVTADASNFFDAFTVPTVNGKKLVREMNLRKTQEMLATTFDTASSYAVGDVVIYQNDLYRCITAVEGGSAWFPSKWQPINMAEVAKEKGAYIVEVSNTGMQTEVKGAEIEKADGIVVSSIDSSIRWKYSEDNNTIVFKTCYVNRDSAQILEPTSTYTRSNRNLNSITYGSSFVTRGNLASSFSSTLYLVAGDLVWYDNGLYQCNQAHHGDWDDTHFNAINVSQAIQAKQDVLVNQSNIKSVNGNSLLGSGNIDISYTAGTGIDISNNEIAVDTSTVAMKSDLPTGTEEINFNDAMTTATDVSLDNIVVGNSAAGYTRYVVGGGTDIGYPAYDATSTYSIGDIVIYDNKIYQCVTAISTAEAWTAAHWDQVNVEAGDIVSVAILGKQDDKMNAKVITAKAIYNDQKLYMRNSATQEQIIFIRQTQYDDMDCEITLIYHIPTKMFSKRTVNLNRVRAVDDKYGSISLDPSLQTTGWSTSGVLGLTGKLPIITDASQITGPNTSGFLTIVVLSEEPAERYDGYLYIITAPAQ